jgi:glycine cleavage system T protein
MESSVAGNLDDFTQTVSGQRTVLYEKHLYLAQKSHIAEFAGYLMPLWYSSIAKEHDAVRTHAGLFDVSHMGVLQFEGPDSEAFLNIVSTNDVAGLSVNQAQYSYILDSNGDVLDDIIVYRLDNKKYMVVVNAANELKIKAYLQSLLKDTTLLKRIGEVEFVDLRTQANGRGRVNIALQGPASKDVLFAMLDYASYGSNLAGLKNFHLLQTSVAGFDVIIARTGYTGAKIGFELFVSPENAGFLWDSILEIGRRFGVEPCGLGARDSLRVEAGLPLYGHELAGEYKISPFEAGYGWAVKLGKDFFVGKDAMAKKAAEYAMEIVRLELPGQKGIRPIRQNDGVLDSGGRCVGWVTSCAGVGQSQIAIAYVMRGVLKEAQSVGVYYLARSQGQIQQGKKERVEKMEILSADLSGRVVSRFTKI